MLVGKTKRPRNVDTPRAAAILYGDWGTGGLAFLVSVPTAIVVVVLGLFTIPHLGEAIHHLKPLSGGLLANWNGFVGIVLALSGVEVIANATSGAASNAPPSGAGKRRPPKPDAKGNRHRLRKLVDPPNHLILILLTITRTSDLYVTYHLVHHYRIYRRRYCQLHHAYPHDIRYDDNPRNRRVDRGRAGRPIIFEACTRCLVSSSRSDFVDHRRSHRTIRFRQVAPCALAWPVSCIQEARVRRTTVSEGSGLCLRGAHWLAKAGAFAYA